MIRTAFIAFLAAVIVGAPGGPVLADARSGPAALVEIVNAARAERRIPPVRYEPRLVSIAEQLTGAIAAGEPLDRHAAGRELLLREKGYPFVKYGARYAVTGVSAEEMVRSWMFNADGAPGIIVDPNVVEVGVAYLSSDGTAVTDTGPNIWALIIAEPARPAREGWRKRVLDFVNGFRIRNGLDPLRPNAFLDRAAMTHAQDMVNRDFFSHFNPDGAGPGDRAEAAGYDFSMVLENLAAGQRDARDAVDAWIRSRDGHREAMLNPAVTELGIGYVFAPYDPGRIDSRHYWSMTLGRPIDQ
jgi:uncharacterized protein YkwD